jgi:integrating conjugative element protein (TIGR03757 family)
MKHYTLGASLVLVAALAPATSVFPAEPVFAVDVFTIDNLSYKMERQRLANLIAAPINLQRIDLIYKFETEISANLPADEDAAYKVATERFSKKTNTEIQQIYADGMKSIQLARSIGVTKVPAVVFNRKWIIYGLDPLRAYQVFEEKNETNQLNSVGGK